MIDMLMSGEAAWFGVPAVVGTMVFALKLVLMLVGGDTHGADLDVDVPQDLAHDVQDSVGAFKALSIQSISAFCMGFGWAGLGAYHGVGSEMFVSILAAVGGGVVMVWMLAMLLKGVGALHSDGTFSMKSAVGTEADVYVTVPAAGAGRGQVKLVMSGRQRIVNATSEGPALPTSARVRIVRVNSDNSVAVEPAGA